MAIPKKRGPQTIYAPKVSPPETALLTTLGKNILRAAATRTGAGKSNVIEHLLRRHGASVVAEDFEPLPDLEPVEPEPVAVGA